MVTPNAEKMIETHTNALKSNIAPEKKEIYLERLQRLLAASQIGEGVLFETAKGGSGSIARVIYHKERIIDLSILQDGSTEANVIPYNTFIKWITNKKITIK